MNERDPLIGATVGDGFCIEEPIWPGLHRARYRGVTPDGRPVVFAITGPQIVPLKKVAPRLSFEHEHVAGVWTVDSLDGADRPLVAMIEDEPLGRPLDGWPPGTIDRRDAIELGFSLARILASAHKERIVLGGIRPELIYAELRGTRPLVSGLMPRAPLFFRTGNPTDASTAFGFGQAFESPELLGGGALAPSSDVFGLCATIGFLATGQHPFGPAPAAAQAVRMLQGPGGWPERDDELLRLCEQGLAADPAARIGADELAARLSRLA